MTDVAKLIDRLELLGAGQSLPGDDEPVHGQFTRGFYRNNKAAVRTGGLAHYVGVDPVPPRLACELVDNLPTILAALQFWKDTHDGR